MPSANFIAELRKSNIKPVLKFQHEFLFGLSNDQTDYVISVGEIRRNIDLMPGYCDVVVDNGDGHFDDYLTSDAMLTKQAVVTMGLSGFANVTMASISFHNNGADPDTIEDSADQWIVSGFKKGMVFEVSGSDYNDGTFTIASITAGVITLLSTDELTDESAGNSITLITEELTLFTGYVESADPDWDNRTITLHLRDRLSLMLENKIYESAIPSATITAATIGFDENAPYNDSISDSGNGFLTAGFTSGMPITITNSLSNNKTVTIADISVDGGTITVSASDDLTDEVQGAATVTIEGPLFHQAWMNYYDVTGTLKQHAMTVSQLVWHILTYFGKLSYTGSSINPDIDYDSWVDWATHVDNGGYALYDIGVVANGESCADVLMKIAQLTESAFYVGGDGKIKFQIVRTPGAWREYTDEVLKVDWSVAMEYRVNAISCAWGYRPDSDNWLSDVNGIAYGDSNVGPANAPYTYTSETERDRSVFHNTSGSADLYIAAKLVRCAAPPREFRITTQSLGFVEDVRTDIALQNLYDSPYDDIGIQINEIAFMPDSWTVAMTGWFIWSF